MIHVIGIGLKGRESLRKRPLGLIKRATLIAGGKRHLDEFPDSGAKKLAIGPDLDWLASEIRQEVKRKGSVVVLATGDPLLFGAASFIIKRFGKRNVEVIPNVSTVQEAFAKIKEDMNGVKVLSAHGRNKTPEELCGELAPHDRAAVFTDSTNTPSRIARALIDKGMTGYRAFVCESLGTKKEKITRGSLAEIAAMRSFGPLNIMVLIRKRPARPAAAKRLGIPDALFSHSKGMITKEELRVIALSKLNINNNSVVWDIGSGCGSVAIEASFMTFGPVYAIEKDKKRAAQIKRNRNRFNAEGVEVVEGLAPLCLKKLPRPDAIFVGGGGAGLRAILSYCARRVRPGGRAVVNAVTIETAHAAFDFFKKKGWEKELLQVGLSRAKDLGRLSLLSANNPVFIISGTRPL
ncbi:MAG: precorrin-6y C5,15-methyltransferase (decarboxylating) subunit CbiE [Deltaproteobacteria bacterium]|nr:precorrin-6y C5,15-methyltransferase (decarboxylating) subunit CbiE [Deltaproteobacteria bacterium]